MNSGSSPLAKPALVVLLLLACDDSGSGPGSGSRTSAGGTNGGGSGGAESRGGGVSSGGDSSGGASAGVGAHSGSGGRAGAGTGGAVTGGGGESGARIGGMGGKSGGAGNTGAGSGGSPIECSDPVFVTSDPNGGFSDGGYYVHNNMWNREEAGPETLYACAHDNWYVESRQPDTTSVKTYPNVHLDINGLDGAPLSDYATITSSFAGNGPRVGIYNFAYDIWLDGVGWGNGTTEFMIWTDNFNQRPLGSEQGSIDFDGMEYDAWHYDDGDANVITLVATSSMLAGTLDLMAMLDWAIESGFMPSDPTINQIGYGVEICSTDDTTQRFTFTDFSVTMN